MGKTSISIVDAEGKEERESRKRL